MLRNHEAIIADLNALSERDFDGTNGAPHGQERLDTLCDELHALGFSEQSVEALFRTMERLDVVDLGSPGSLVHTLERWPRLYEKHLAESVQRRPSRLGVWMINRILNSRPPGAEAWLRQLRSVKGHPLASNEARACAEQFLRYHTSL